MYAIECIRKLLQNNESIKITAFGDYKLDEIPADIRNEIIYYYRLSRKVLLGLYNKSIIFVLPSIVEGMPSPPLEAMACGCAVVVTDNGGVNEYIKDGLNGIVCPVRDSYCLYQKVILLINNKALREQMIQDGLETAKEFSYDNMNKNFIRLIEEVQRRKS
ncbi:glycosyltransferase [Thermoplasma volcanium]|uniref:glycosyltransferase n=1 Tax=Thermoplasma volcanium TaxID=50339 RepID=UPI000A029447